MSDDEIMIRGVLVKDIASLHNLCHELGYDTPAESLPKCLNDIVSDPNQAVFVAEYPAHEIVGFIHMFVRLALEAEPCAQVQALVVAERARRAGVADKLIQSAEIWAMGRDLNLLSLYCVNDRDAAHDFYPALGFDAISTATRFNKRLD